MKMKLKHSIDRLFKLPGWLLAIISLVFLIVTAWSAWRSESTVIQYKRTILQSPEVYAGMRVCMPYARIVRIKRDTAYTVTTARERYRFLVDTNKVRLHQTYSFAGELQSDGSIRVMAVHHHKHRILKYVLSLLSLPIVIYLMVSHFRLDSESWTLIEKSGGSRA